MKKRPYHLKNICLKNLIIKNSELTDKELEEIEGEALPAVAVDIVVGAVGGAASYVVGQCVNYFQTGKWEWSWGDFFLSVATGAALSVPLSKLAGILKK
jgi:lactobin A/cerein 7B family class IIb bacteriocin